jgi:cell pole-organizing protein PopZ
MNKPATKEPSMDEILSSIRQIIADDDAAASVTSVPPPPPARPAEPLALSANQMLPKAEPVRPVPPTPEPKSMASVFEQDAEEEEALAAFEMPTGEPELVDPEDVHFEGDPEPAPPPPAPVFKAPEPPARRPEPPPPPRPASPVSHAAPMPDPRLSSDMAEELLEPATNAAVHGTFAKLSAMTAVPSGVTVDSIMREMLRPMLKEWLDENLPSVVERMVEKEIARISRGAKS